MGWLKVLGEFIVVHGKGLFEKRRRVWVTLLIAISTGVIQKVNSIKLENSLMVYVRIAFLISVVALILWAIEYTWLEITNTRKIKREMKEKANNIREMVDGFSRQELNFLMNFDKKSKRAKINYGDEVYSTMTKLGVVEFIEYCPGCLAHIKLSDEYKEEYGRICERHKEMVKEEELFWESFDSVEEH